MYAEPDYNGKVWKKISSEGVDFVKSNLNFNTLYRTPNKRSFKENCFK